MATRRFGKENSTFGQMKVYLIRERKQNEINAFAGHKRNSRKVVDEGTRRARIENAGTWRLLYAILPVKPFIATKFEFFQLPLPFLNLHEPSILFSVCCLQKLVKIKYFVTDQKLHFWGRNNKVEE